MKLKIIRILSFLFNKSGLWKSDIFLRVAAKFNNFVKKPGILIINGKKLFIHKRADPLSSSLYFYGKYEPFETKMFKKLIKKGDKVIDLGAHIGYYSLIASSLVGKTGKVFSFEPDPDNLILLHQNVEANKIKNVAIVDKAVTNANKKIKLYISNENKGDNRLFKRNSKEKSIEVDGVTLDAYFGKLNLRVDFIKMDIQGAEVKALQGMPNVLRNNRDVVLIFEFWPYGYSKTGGSAKELLDILDMNKFFLFDIGKNDARDEPVLTSADFLLQNYHPDNLKEMTNIMCLRDKARLN